MNVRTTKYVLLSNYSVFGVCSIFDGWIWCFRGGGGGAADALNYIMRARTTLVRLSGGRINSAAALRQIMIQDNWHTTQFAQIRAYFLFSIWLDSVRFGSTSHIIGNFSARWIVLFFFLFFAMTFNLFTIHDFCSS